MDVILTARVPCVICGHRRRAFSFVSARVNKRSMRGTSHLTWRPGRCDECGFDDKSPAPETGWRIVPDDLAKIRAYRLKRWPELQRKE
jgi:hypothetical protein